MTDVRAVMTAPVKTIDASATIGDALEALEGAGIHHLPVLEGGRLAGMLSSRDVRAWRQAWKDRRDGVAGAEVDALLSRPIRARMNAAPVSVEPNAPAGRAVMLLLEHHIGALPVVEGEAMVGIVSGFDLLVLLWDVLYDQPVARTVEDLLGGETVSVDADAPAAEALEVMLARGTRCAPVIDSEGALAGVFSARARLEGGVPYAAGVHPPGREDVYRAAGRRVREVMRPAASAAPDTPLGEAAARLLEGGAGCLPVVEGGRLVGALTEADFVRHVARSATI